MKRWAWRSALFLLLGAALSVAVALAAAALRPTDGYPNVLGTSMDKFPERYFLPQHRQRTPDGDVFVDIMGGPTHTLVSLAPVWVRRLKPEDSWIFTTYPYVEDVPEWARAVHGNPTSYELPSWATRCNASSTEHNLNTSAWGWPLRCLSGTEHVYASYAPDGKFLGTRSTFDTYLVRGSGAAGMRVRRIPLHVIPLGLALDTAFGALAIAGVVYGIRGLWGLRAVLRRRRGLCPACGYPVGTGAVCPECGQAVVPRFIPTSTPVG